MNGRIEALVNMSEAERFQLLAWLALNYPGPVEAGMARGGKTTQDVPAFWYIRGTGGGTGGGTEQEACQGRASEPGACQERAT